jgi:hypothetical protein
MRARHYLATSSLHSSLRFTNPSVNDSGINVSVSLFAVLDHHVRVGGKIEARSCESWSIRHYNSTTSRSLNKRERR